jgi:hypothetical protein
MKSKELMGIRTIIFGLITFSLITACDVDNTAPEPNETSVNIGIDENEVETLPKEELSVGETDGLLLMREEEKLARDVYITLYNKWGLRVFGNISQSEQRHTNAVKALLDKYELDDPVVKDSIGVFTNTTLADLYGALTVSGDSSLISALKVGALIEEIDILDLQRELDENVDNQDITYVYERLLNGSYNHLRAFVRNLSRQGITYKPVKMTDEQYEKIISD